MWPLLVHFTAIPCARFRAAPLHPAEPLGPGRMPWWQTPIRRRARTRSATAACRSCGISSDTASLSLFLFCGETIAAPGSGRRDRTFCLRDRDAEDALHGRGSGHAGRPVGRLAIL